MCSLTLAQISKICKRMEQTTTEGLAQGQTQGRIRFILRNRWTFSSPQARLRRLSLHKSNIVHSLLSMLYFLFSSFFVSIPFLVLSPFLIYFYFYHILTIHSHLTPILSWHLLLLTSKEDGGRNLLSCDLHCSSHFLINAADKVVAHHLMRMQQATLG